MATADQRIQTLIRHFGKCRSIAECHKFILDHPAMIHMRIVRAVCEGDAQIGARFLHAIEVAGAKVERQGSDGFAIRTNADRYPVGPGPIEAIWDSLEKRSISLETAVEQARAPRIGELLTYVYVKALCDKCDTQARSGDLQGALQRQRLIVEATEAFRNQEPITTESDVWEMRVAAAHSWLEIVAVALVSIADPRWLRHADEIAERLLAEARGRSDTTTEGRLLQRLGVLYLDPYTATRRLDDLHNYELSLKLWQLRLRDHLGRAYDLLPEADKVMPPVREALARSEAYLRQALKFRSAAAKVETIAALLQAIQALSTLGVKSDLDERIALAREGLALLGDSGNDERRIRLSNMLNGALAERRRGQSASSVGGEADSGGGAPAGAPRAGRSDSKSFDPRDDADEEPASDDEPAVQLVRRLLNTPLSEIAPGEGVLEQCDIAVQAINSMRAIGRNAVALQLIAHFRALVVVGREEFRDSVLESEIVLLRNWLSEGDRPVATTAEPEPVPHKPTVSDKQIAEHLTTALRSGPENREAEGLKAIQAIAALDKPLVARHGMAFAWFVAKLTLGEGTNLFNRRDLTAAVAHYVGAMVANARLGMMQTVFDCLDRLEDVTRLYDYQAMYFLVRQLEPVARDVEAATGEPGTLRLQSIYRRVSAFWLTPSGATAVDEDTIFRTLRLAKGHWFAGALGSPVHFDWRRDDEARRQLDAIASLAAQLGLPPDNVGMGDGAIAERMLVRPAGPHEQRPGSDDEQRYENLRLAFNEYVKRRQAELAATPDRPRAALSLAEFQARIKPHAIVLDYFAGADLAENPVLYILAITRDEVVLRASKLAFAGGDGEGLKDGPLARLVLEVREGITAMPGFQRAVGRGAEAALLAGEQQLLGPVKAFLTEQRARGCSGLVVVPHGPLKVLPLHLLGAIDAPVGQSWVVTYLPDAAMLAAPCAQRPPPPANTLIAVGLDFHDDDHPGTPPINEAPAFVCGLADAMNGKSLVNREATEARVTDALQSSRYVHIYTHGLQCAYAAAFHALFVAADPAAGQDGVLRSYEVLPLRCQGLEVLTLSACESALGRFDSGDNLIGLPGSLLLAGVQRIVGCLWPVASAVAELFFAQFYEALRSGADFVDAFRRAQLAVRASHREYRDWGAFYFIGPG